MQSKICSSDQSWNLWKYKGLKGWKGQASVVPSDRVIPWRLWYICKSFTVTEEDILHQALLFPIWEKARNCHYLSSITLAAGKEREYIASLLSALLATTDLSIASCDLCLLADTSTGQVFMALGGEEGSKFTTSERRPKKPHWGHKCGFFHCLIKTTQMKCR